MKLSQTLKIAGIVLAGTIYMGSPMAAFSAEEMSGHKAGAGHDHGKVHKADDHKDADGHDHGHENAAEHAKHHPKPSHGGVVLEMDEHHGELVIKDGMMSLYMSDHDGKPASAKDFSATAMILTATGRQGPVNLAPSDGNKLTSADKIKTGAGTRIIITLKDPHGHMTQARHQMP